jgi:hypothetical protein
MLDTSTLENVNVDPIPHAPYEFVQKPPCLGVEPSIITLHFLKYEQMHMTGGISDEEAM